MNTSKNWIKDLIPLIGKPRKLENISHWFRNLNEHSQQSDDKIQRDGELKTYSSQIETS